MALAFCAVPATAAEWPRTDVAPDPAIRLGVLPNGMRYAIMKNQTPAGAVSVRFSLAVGSSHEAPGQRGFSHFIEHMAFRGSKNFPDGEINRSLERLGLRFGADTNASTGRNMTLYMFNLPTADPASVDEALAITRDIAGNVSFDASAVETEAGVIMSEAAMRGTPSLRGGKAQLEFLLVDPRASALPGSDPSIVEHPKATDLLRYYRAYYRPERAILTIVGDVDPDRLAAQIAARFADWKGVGESGSDPAFQVPTNRGLEAHIHVEAGTPSQIMLAWVQPPFVHPVDRAGWKRLHVSAVALQIANRRLAALAASQEHPFTSASAGEQDMLHAAKLFILSANFEGEWQKALTALAQTRLALLHAPVSQAEIDAAVAAQKAAVQRAEMSADTRASTVLASFLAANAVQGDVAVSPAQQRAATDEDLAGLDAEAVNNVLKDAFGGDPLIFVSSRNALKEDERAVMDAYRAVADDAKPLSAAAQAVKWPYTSFGEPGSAMEAQSAPDIGVTSLRFANNVRLLVRPSKLRLNQVQVTVKLGSGRLGLPTDRAVSWLFSGFLQGGLGALSSTDMVAALSGKNYRAGFGVADGAFVFNGETTPRDLETQLQLFAAYIKDPGFRPAEFEQFKQRSVSLLRAADATPAGVMGLMSSGILHGGDKRWTSPTLEEIRAASVDDLKTLVTPVLAEAPIEVIITGDITAEAARHAVAVTLGALPSRLPSNAAPGKGVSFPANAAPVVLQTSTSSSQTLASMAWGTQGYFADLKDDAALHLLAAILREKLLDAVRGQGLSYSVQVAMPSSGTYDYGYISATATMPAGKAQTFYDAADEIVRDLKAGRIDADTFERARAPTLQDLRKTVQTNDYWTLLLTNGWDLQARFNRARNYDHILESVTPDDVAAVARKYLTGTGVRISAGS